MKELQLCKSDEITKEAGMIELRRQCTDLVRSKTIECNILVNKPLPQAGTITLEKSETTASEGTSYQKLLKNSKSNLNHKGTKNL